MHLPVELTHACDRVVCPVAVVSQWASEVKRMAPGLLVVEHHGPTRATGKGAHTLPRTLTEPGLDPKRLEQAHVVVTSYTTVASEYGTYSGGKNEGKNAKKKQADSDSDSDSSSVGRSLKKGRAKKAKDALFRVQWWRVVLGWYRASSGESRELTST